MDPTLIKTLLIAGGAYFLWVNWKRQIDLQNLDQIYALSYDPNLYLRAKLQQTDIASYFRMFGTGEGNLGTQNIDQEIGRPKFAEEVAYRDIFKAPTWA